MVDTDGKPFIKYPYAEDGLVIWTAMEKYFSDYLGHYYGSGTAGDSKVAADEELQAFWKDVTVRSDVHSLLRYGLAEFVSPGRLVLF